MNRRDFLQALGVSAAAGFPLLAKWSAAQAAADMMYERPAFGNVSLIHLADLHGQLLPGYFREAELHIGVGRDTGSAPFLVGESFLEHYRVMPGSRLAHALTYLQFVDAATIYGKMGGVAHLATLIQRLRAGRPDSLLLDSGDSWQGSALSHLSRGRDMVEVTRALGVDAMTGDWEFALGTTRLREILGGELGSQTSFLAQNGKLATGEEAGFRSYSVYFVNGVGVGVIGLACPTIGLGGARDFAPQWDFSLDEQALQNTVNLVHAKGARVVVLLSHLGLPGDIKLASRVRGIDVILGGHTHDVTPNPVVVTRFGGQTLIVAGGAGGKFVGVMDLQVAHGKIGNYRYSLLPVFANLLPPDADMQARITRLRAPHAARLGEVLARTEGIVYRRDNFGSTFDQLVLEALRVATGADVVFSPGFRWGHTLLPGDQITLEYVLDHMSVPHAGVLVEHLTGAQLHERMERWSDYVFNPDPYQQTGDDMVRVGGMTYVCEPGEVEGARLSDFRLGRKLIEAGKTYRVASWGLADAGPGAPQAWQVVADYLRKLQTVSAQVPVRPGLIGVTTNRGFN